jgi:hypothetical protein
MSGYFETCRSINFLVFWKILINGYMCIIVNIMNVHLLYKKILLLLFLMFGDMHEFNEAFININNGLGPQKMCLRCENI